MSRTVTFGIVGGYGATGRIVASELWKSCDGEILVGGRDLAKGRALAAEFDNRVSAVQLDILDAHSLDEFCSRCSIIVNCAGPVIATGSRSASGLSELGSRMQFAIQYSPSLEKAGDALNGILHA